MLVKGDGFAQERKGRGREEKVGSKGVESSSTVIYTVSLDLISGRMLSTCRLYVAS